MNAARDAIAETALIEASRAQRAAWSLQTGPRITFSDRVRIAMAGYAAQKAGRALRMQPAETLALTRLCMRAAQYPASPAARLHMGRALAYAQRHDRRSKP